MEIFPAQYSTLSSFALQHHLEKAYGFEDLSCSLLVRNVSDVYIVNQADAKYIFKVYRKPYRTFGEISGEVELLNILHQNRVPVSYAIRDIAGHQIQQFEAAEGLRYGVLFSFAKGKVAIDPDDDQLAVIGKNIALMHNVTAICVIPFERPVYNLEKTLNHPLKIMKHRFSDMPEAYNMLRDLGSKAEEKLRAFDTVKFSFGYCHYDLLPKNFHFDEDNRIAFFDFDWMGKGFLVNDLMTFYVQLFFLVYLHKVTQEAADEKFQLLVSAYRAVRPVSEQELAAIPYLGILFWIHGFGFYEENFDDFANTFPTPRFIKERLELIKNGPIGTVSFKIVFVFQSIIFAQIPGTLGAEC